VPFSVCTCSSLPSRRTRILRRRPGSRSCSTST